MKKQLFRTLAISLLSTTILWSCSKSDDAKLPDASFDVTVTGESPTAQITLTNTSKDATEYKWVFGEGASMIESNVQSPSEITVDKAGDLSIKLIATSSEGTDSITKNVTIDGASAILLFSDIKFGLTANDSEYGRSFSIDDGKIYLDDEISSENGSKLDMVLECIGWSACSFISPSNESLAIPNAKESVFINYDYDDIYSDIAANFDLLNDDSLLSGLNFNDDENIFPISGADKNHLVMFKTAEGKVGAIKTKSYTNDYLEVDIKVQKY